MTRDRGRSDLVSLVVVVAISILAYAAWFGFQPHGLGPITYTFAWWHLLAVPGVALALLLARGMYLIGQGTDAEFDARAKAADSTIIGSGFFLLDWLRTASLPFLGEGETQRTYRCGNCRHTFQSTQRAGWPACPNCGDEKPEVIQ